MNGRLHHATGPPLVAFLGLMHVRITRLFTVLRRRGCGDQGGIDNRAFAHQQPLLGQLPVDDVEDAPRQVAGFEQASELEQGGCVRSPLAAQIDTDKPADRLAVVDGILDA